MNFVPARSPAPTAPLGQRPTQQPAARRGVKAMADAEGERPASPAQEPKKGEAASPQAAKPAAPEPKKEGLHRIPSIPVTTRANDGVGEQLAAAAAAAAACRRSTYCTAPISLCPLCTACSLPNCSLVLQSSWRFGICAASSSRRTRRECRDRWGTCRCGPRVCTSAHLCGGSACTTPRLVSSPEAAPCLLQVFGHQQRGRRVR